MYMYLSLSLSLQINLSYHLFQLIGYSHSLMDVIKASPLYYEVRQSHDYHMTLHHVTLVQMIYVHWLRLVASTQ